MSLNMNEARLEALLDRLGVEYESQGVAAGHRCDALTVTSIDGFGGPIERLFSPIGTTFEESKVRAIAWEANGRWWHGKSNIVECDVLKVTRLVRAQVLPVAFWDDDLKDRSERWLRERVMDATEVGIVRSLRYDDRVAAGLPDDVVRWLRNHGCAF